MLKKINRLKSKKDFEEIKNKGKMYNSPFFSLLILNSDINDNSCCQFGFIISKKISKKAVDRNRIKRLLSVSLKKNLDKFNKSTKGIFLVKRLILEKSLAEIEQEVEKMVQKIK